MDPPVDSDIERVKRLWDETSTARETCSVMGWLDSPAVLNHYVLPIIGGPGSRGNWVEIVMRDAGVPRGGSWLSLGCGAGGQEVWCAEQGLCQRMEAIDISRESIAIAKQSAEEKGLTNIEFSAGDFDEVELRSRSYDVILMAMSLHHVSGPNRLLPRLARALKSDGWLLVNEYIGPSQFQYPRKQIAIVNQLLDVLSDRLRYDYVTEQVKREYVQHTRGYWFSVDPSESICSDKIEAAIHRYFRVRLNRPYGGTILCPLLEHIVGNFSTDDEKDKTILQLLGCLEQILIGEKVLKNDFAVFGGQPRRGPVSLLSWPFQILDHLQLAWKRAIAGLAD